MNSGNTFFLVSLKKFSKIYPVYPERPTGCFKNQNRNRDLSVLQDFTLHKFWAHFECHQAEMHCRSSGLGNKSNYILRPKLEKNQWPLVAGMPVHDMTGRDVCINCISTIKIHTFKVKP